MPHLLKGISYLSKRISSQLTPDDRKLLALRGEVETYEAAIKESYSPYLYRMLEKKKREYSKLLGKMFKKQARPAFAPNAQGRLPL